MQTPLEIAKKVFPFAFYYMQWKGYPEPDVPNLFLTDEPVYNYHNITETKTKPDCDIFREYSKLHTGKIYRREGMYAKTKNNSKQTIAHQRLVDTLPKKYKTIIKLRYDTILSTKVDFMPYLEKAQNGTPIGFSNPGKKCTGDEPLQVKPFAKWYLYDHLIFQPRYKMKNTEKFFNEKNLLGAEWGWYQILCHQWNEPDHINVDGGNILYKFKK